MMRLPFCHPMRDRPLVPEDLPWLAHTQFWPRFSRIERLRANQLMGLLINEICLVVEHGLIRIGLTQALNARELMRQPALRQRLAAMLADEDRHTAWFTGFNRMFDPFLYGKSGLHFVSPPSWLKHLARWLAAAPGAWRLTTWLVMATEEWACGLAEVLQREPFGELGVRDPSFQQLHTAHRRDECRHVAMDADILALAAKDMSNRSKQLIVGSARVGLAQLMRPRRAAPAMLAQFAQEFPRWRPELSEMVRAVTAVGAHRDYWRSRGVAAQLSATSSCARAWGSHFWNAAND